MATAAETRVRAQEKEREIRYGDIRKQRLGADLITYILLGLGAAVVLVPFAWMLGTSLTARDKLFVYPPQFVPNPVVWLTPGTPCPYRSPASPPIRYSLPCLPCSRRFSPAAW
jgi:hypothetical protein